ncbi:MAG: hypothetical protein A3B68_09335 [Candidatus Melainabacteria bacterium RIFCSPHIGHO2_02_FULL_34_12]|nr:MAG: hypothetical protein A3B68_09335 [Candidatus Melainabacteria bacterium RIFCSPHIGHO2_02_FULL_34_12]
MVIEAARSITIIPRRSTSQYFYSGKPNLKLIDTGRAIASKAAFEASLQRSQLSQKYWDELLEKLRKAGGGGGGSSNFDRVTVSMQLMNFLSNKAILAILKSFNVEFLKLTNNISEQLQKPSQNQFLAGIQKIGFTIFSGIAFIVATVIRKGLLQQAPTGMKLQIPALAVSVSFQLNKLKEILEEELKELIKKLDVKEKIRRLKASVTDFFVEMKREIINVVEWLKSAALLHIEGLIKKKA